MKMFILGLLKWIFFGTILLFIVLTVVEILNSNTIVIIAYVTAALISLVFFIAMDSIIKEIKGTTINETTARVLAKTSKVIGDAVSTNTIFLITFEFPDGSRRSLPVDAVRSSLIFEGDIWFLVYKQYKDRLLLMDFQPSKQTIR